MHVRGCSRGSNTWNSNQQLNFASNNIELSEENTNYASLTNIITQNSPPRL